MMSSSSSVDAGQVGGAARHCERRERVEMAERAARESLMMRRWERERRKNE